jgi:hypothetical protein
MKRLTEHFHSITGTIPSTFCGEGATTLNILYRQFKCDAVLCRPGTFNVYGHATLYSACRKCPAYADSPLLGRIECPGLSYIHGDLDGDGLLSPREILRTLYIGEKLPSCCSLLSSRLLITRLSQTRWVDSGAQHTKLGKIRP